MSDEAAELRRIQEWMLTVVMNPEGASAGVDSDAARRFIPTSTDALDEVILPSRNLASVDRLAVYANMYYWRLIDVLADDFPAVRHALGWDRFEPLARAFIATHPSRFFTLSRLGRKFPDFIANEADDVPHRAFVAELARIEIACDEVFDARRSTRLATSELEAVAPEDWGDVRLRTVDALRLLALDHPANAYVQSVRDGEEPEIPGPSPTWLMVRRSDEYTVWRSDLTAEQYGLLRALEGGETLAGALEAAASVPDANVEQLMGSVGSWFQKWTALGVFAALEGPDRPAAG